MYIFSLIMVNIKLDSLSLTIDFSDCHLIYMKPMVLLPNHIKWPRDTAERVSATTGNYTNQPVSQTRRHF